MFKSYLESLLFAGKRKPIWDSQLHPMSFWKNPTAEEIKFAGKKNGFVRAVVCHNNDWFIMNPDQGIHIDLLRYLVDTGDLCVPLELKKNIHRFPHLQEYFITLQQFKKSNVFTLGESNKDPHLETIEKYLIPANKKHSQYVFIAEPSYKFDNDLDILKNKFIPKYIEDNPKWGFLDQKEIRTVL